MNDSTLSAATAANIPKILPFKTKSHRVDFRGLMWKIKASTEAGELSAAQVNAALAGVGLKPEEMAQLINNAPLIASLNAALDTILILNRRNVPAVCKMAGEALRNHWGYDELHALGWTNGQLLQNGWMVIERVQS